jgi:hypothetical protein
MKKALLVLPVIAAAIAFGGPVSSSGADENALGRCPDHYTPVPAFVVTEDRNENGVICVKFVGSHENTHDDPKGKKYRCNGVAPPAECQSDPEGSFFVLDDIVD